MAGVQNIPKLFCHISYFLCDQLSLPGQRRIKVSQTLQRELQTHPHLFLLLPENRSKNHGSLQTRFCINVLQNLVHISSEILGNSFFSAQIPSLINT